MAQARPNFGSILDRKPSSIEKPKTLPVGTYLCIVQGMPRQDKAKTGTMFLEYTLKYMQATDDVDQEDLQAALTRADGTTKKLQEMTIKLKFFITEDAAYRLTDFLEHCGLNEEDFESTRQMSEAAGGCQVLVKLKHVPSDDGESVYANVDRTAPVE